MSEGGKKKTKQLTKSPRKRKVNKSLEKVIKMEKGKESTEEKRMSQKASEEKLNDTIDSVIKLYEADDVKEMECENCTEANKQNTGTDATVNEIKPPVEEIAEWDCNTSIESIDVKQSPEHSAESGSGKFRSILLCCVVTYNVLQNSVRSLHRTILIPNQKIL